MSPMDSATTGDPRPDNADHIASGSREPSRFGAGGGVPTAASLRAPTLVALGAPAGAPRWRGASSARADAERTCRSPSSLLPGAAVRRDGPGTPRRSLPCMDRGGGHKWGRRMDDLCRRPAPRRESCAKGPLDPLEQWPNRRTGHETQAASTSEIWTVQTRSMMQASASSWRASCTKCAEEPVFRVHYTSPLINAGSTSCRPASAYERASSNSSGTDAMPPTRTPCTQDSSNSSGRS